MPETDSPDRRSSTRQRTLKGARAVYGNFALSTDCVVRDMSPTGARLRVDPDIHLPAEFHLLLPGDQLICKVRTVWRRGNEIGITYLEPMRNPKTDPDPRISRLIF